MALKTKFNPQWTPVNRPKIVDGHTAGDIVEAAQAIANDEWVKKHQRQDRRREQKHKKAVAAVSLAKMPWDAV